MTNDNSAVLFNSYRNLRGMAVPADTYRRNGQRVPRCVPEGIDMDLEDDSRDTHVLRVLSAGLNPLERRTWWRILDGWSLSAIADADHVSRAAVYCRIRGSRRSGGMVAKNRWVALWWAARATAEPV